MTEERRNTPSATAEIKLAESKAGLISRIVAGAFFMLVGTGVFAYALLWRAAGASPCDHNHGLMIVGGGTVVGGALMLPSVFDHFQPVVVFFFPNGVPFFGGRRVGDPPKPPEVG